MCQLSPVTFHGDTIFCIEHQNQPYAPMRPIVENMGLDWKSQSAKLNANKGRWGMVIITTPSKGGDQQALCLPVRKLPAFLASINPRKVRPELRERIELYQAECDDALWNYWMHGKAERPAPGPARRNIADDIVPAPRGADALARVVDVEALSGGMLRLHLESARGAWTCPMSAAAVAARDIRRGDTLRFASSGRLLGVDLTRRPADALPPDLTEPAVPALTGVEQAWLRCIAADSEVICEEFGLIRERLRRQDDYIQALEAQMDELRQRPDPRLNQIFGDMWDMKMRLAALLRERGLAGAPSLPPAATDAGGISGPACGRVKRFLEQRCRRSEGARAAAGALYAAFVRWHGEGADGVPSKKTFGVCLGRLCRRVRSNGSWYEGIALLK